MRIKSHTLRGSVVALALLSVVLAAAQKSYTYPQYLSKAKALGYPADNCSYCHRSPSGGNSWNERGKWLIEEKRRREADQVDVRWLRDYKPVAAAGRDGGRGAGPARRPGATAR